MDLSALTSGNRAGALFGVAAFAVFATHDLFIKQLGGGYSPFQILFFNALLSFPFIAVYLISDSKPGTLRPVHPWWVAGRSIAGAVSTIGAFYAFATLPLSQVYAILFAMPMLITVLAIPMLGEKVGLRRGLAVLVGLCGVVVVVNPGEAEFGLGHLAATCSAMAGALNAVIVRKVGGDERAVVMVLYPMLTNLVVAAVFLPFVYVEVQLVDLGFMAVAAGLSMVGMVLLVMAYARASAITVAPMQYTQILWAVFYGALFFSEYPVQNTYVGTGIIILSGIYILKREASGKVVTQSPVLQSRTRPGLANALRVGIFLKDREKRP